MTVENSKVRSYRDLIIWQKSMDLVEQVYLITDKFPKQEVYGLTSQLRRCSVSIPSNIAEGSRRFSQKSFKNFLTIAYGSGAEIETQLEIARRLNFIEQTEYNKLENAVNEIQKMINGFINKMRV